MAAHTSTMSTRGQIVIPADLREEMSLEPGTRFVFRREGSRLSIQPVNEAFVDAAMGMFKPKPGEASMSDLLMEDRRRERKLEDLKWR